MPNCSNCKRQVTGKPSGIMLSQVHAKSFHHSLGRSFAVRSIPTWTKRLAAHAMAHKRQCAARLRPD